MDRAVISVSIGAAQFKRGELQLTIDKMQAVLNGLKLKLSDVFPEEF